MDTIRDEKLLHEKHSGHCLISWSAIISGALVAFSLSILFHILNTGLGLVSFPQFFKTLIGVTVAGYIWLVICGIIAMFIAGWLTGKIVKHQCGACFGALHGFLAWSLALLISVILTTHVVAANAGAQNANPDNRAVAARVIDQHEVSLARVEQVAEVSGAITLGIFFIVLLGAIAATFGGYVGAKDGHTHETGKPSRL